LSIAGELEMKRKDELKELRGASKEALQEKISSAQEELMKLRFKHASGQLESSARSGVLRRSIARAKTILRQNAAR
jgi:large subunit ribosomal protein L29